MIKKMFGRDKSMRSTFLKYDPCVRGPKCTVRCEDCMVSLISDRFLGKKFAEEVLSKKYRRTANLFTYVLIADTIGCNLNCWFCYAWKLLNVRDARGCSPHVLSAEQLANQFACKIRATADLGQMKAAVFQKYPQNYSSEDQVGRHRNGILRHLDLGLPFSRLRVSGGEPLFSNRDVFQTEDVSEDLLTQTIRYWIDFFEVLDESVGQIKRENLINIAPFDSDWHLLEHPVWLTEAQNRIMVRFDTNGIVFRNERLAKLFYSELFRLFQENKLNSVHVQIDYSFKGATPKEYMWSQSKELPTTPENNDRDLDLARHPQVRGLENIFSDIEDFTSRDAGFKHCVSVTIEKGIDHDWGSSKLWLYYPNALDWQILADGLAIEFSDVVNHFDLNFGWRFGAKVQRYTKRGAMIELTDGCETIDATSASIQELGRFYRQHGSRKDYMTLVYPVGRRVQLYGKGRPRAKPVGEVEVPPSDQNYWIITGSEQNMRLGVKHGLWGIREGQADLWRTLKKGDLLFFYCTRPVSGIVGYGSVIDTHAETTPFWPNENPDRESRYRLRIRFQAIHEVEDWRRDRHVLIGTGTDFRHGLNYVQPGKKVLLDKLRVADA